MEIQKAKRKQDEENPTNNSINRMEEAFLSFPLKLDFTAKNKIGQTGYQLAQFWGKTGVVNLIRTRMPSIAN